MAEQRYVFKESTIKAIVNSPRNILGMSEDQKFSPDAIPNLIYDAATHMQQSGYNSGLEEGYNNGYNEGGEAGFSSGFAEGKRQGKLELVQDTESLQATATGTSLVLDDISPIEHELDIKVIPKNHFDISKVYVGGYVKSNTNGTLHIVTSDSSGGNAGGSNAQRTLKYYAPGLEAGKTYILSLASTGTSKYIYLSGANISWISGNSLTMTQAILDSRVLWYASGSYTEAYVSNIEIQYKPYLTNPPVSTLEISDNSEFNNSTQFTSDSNGSFGIITRKYPVTYLVLNNPDEEVTIECKYIRDINKTVEEVEAQAARSAHDIFWDSYQGSGTRASYQYAFAGTNWNNTTFKPKYDIILDTGYTGTYMFWSCGVSNLKETLQNLGIVLDTSKSQYMGNAFQSINSKALPKIDLSNASLSTAYCFSSPNISIIDELVLSENTNIVTSTFNNAKGFTHVIFSGVAAKTIDLHWSTLLDKASIVSLFNTLSTTTTGQTATVSKAAVNKAFETSSGANDGSTSEEWLTLTGTRTNWTIAVA